MSASRRRAATHRWARALPFVVLGVEALAVGTGWLDVGLGAVLLVTVEACLASIAIVIVWRQARTADGADLTMLDRLEAGLASLMPAQLAHLVVAELRDGRAAVIGARGRVEGLTETDVPLPYAAGRRAVPMVFVVLVMLEAVAIHLAVPWTSFGAWAGLRWTVLGVSAYGLIWLAALLLAERGRPHLAGAARLLLRVGPASDVSIPWSVVVSAQRRERLSRDEDPRHLSLDGPLQPTTIDLVLGAPVAVRTMTSRSRRVDQISIAVDEPERAYAVITARLASSRLAGSPPVGIRLDGPRRPTA